MKLKYIAISLLALTLFASCNRDEESLFEKSAAQRAVEAVENANNVFTAAPNGWEILYFANPDSRGYNILVHFDANAKVTASIMATDATTGVFSLSKGTILSDSSTWNVISDYGPILSFDTYNQVLHAWADPQSDGDGLLGDYEFLILKAESDYVRLKGKKHSGYSEMHRLSAEQDWKQYFSDIDSLQHKFFDNSNILQLNLGNDCYTLFDGENGIFQLGEHWALPAGEEVEVYPFVTTQTGIRLQTGFRSYSDDLVFTFKDDHFESANGQLTIGPLNEYVGEYMHLVSGIWTMDITANAINATTAAAIKSVDAQLQTMLKQKKAKTMGITFAGMQTTADSLFYVLKYQYSAKGNTQSLTELPYMFAVEKVDEGISLTYTKPADTSAENVLKSIPEILAVLESLNGEYAITAEETINPTLGLHFVGKTDANKWFNLAVK